MELPLGSTKGSATLDDYAAVMEFRADRAARERVNATLDNPQTPLAIIASAVRQASAEMLGFLQDEDGRQRSTESDQGVRDRTNKMDRILSEAHDAIARQDPSRAVKMIGEIIINQWHIYRDPRYHTRSMLQALDVYSEACQAIGDTGKAVGVADVASHLSGVLDGFETIEYARRLVHISELDWHRGYPHPALLTLEEAETLVRKIAKDDLLLKTISMQLQKIRELTQEAS